jgi:hypothetical protein
LAESFEPLTPPSIDATPVVPEPPRSPMPPAPVDPLIAIADRIETMRPVVAPETAIASIMGRVAIVAVVGIIGGGLLMGVDPVRVVMAAAAAGVLLIFAAELLIGLATAGARPRGDRAIEARAARAARRMEIARLVGLIDAPPAVDPKGKVDKKAEKKTEKDADKKSEKKGDAAKEKAA